MVSIMATADISCGSVARIFFYASLLFVQAAISGTAGAVKGLFVTLCSGKPCSAAADERLPSDK